MMDWMINWWFFHTVQKILMSLTQNRKYWNSLEFGRNIFFFSIKRIEQIFVFGRRWTREEWNPVFSSKDQVFTQSLNNIENFLTILSELTEKLVHTALKISFVVVVEKVYSNKNCLKSVFGPWTKSNSKWWKKCRFSLLWIHSSFILFLPVTIEWRIKHVLINIFLRLRALNQSCFKFEIESKTKKWQFSFKGSNVDECKKVKRDRKKFHMRHHKNKKRMHFFDHMKMKRFCIERPWTQSKQNIVEVQKKSGQWTDFFFVLNVKRMLFFFFNHIFEIETKETSGMCFDAISNPFLIETTRNHHMSSHMVSNNFSSTNILLMNPISMPSAGKRIKFYYIKLMTWKMTNPLIQEDMTWNKWITCWWHVDEHEKKSLSLSLCKSGQTLHTRKKVRESKKTFFMMF